KDSGNRQHPLVGRRPASHSALCISGNSRYINQIKKIAPTTRRIAWETQGGSPSCGTTSRSSAKTTPKTISPISSWMSRPSIVLFYPCCLLDGQNARCDGGLFLIVQLLRTHGRVTNGRYNRAWASFGFSSWLRVWFGAMSRRFRRMAAVTSPRPGTLGTAPAPTSTIGFTGGRMGQSCSSPNGWAHSAAHKLGLPANELGVVPPGGRGTTPPG